MWKTAKTSNPAEAALWVQRAGGSADLQVTVSPGSCWSFWFGWASASSEGFSFPRWTHCVGICPHHTLISWEEKRMWMKWCSDWGFVKSFSTRSSSNPNSSPGGHVIHSTEPEPQHLRGGRLVNFSFITLRKVSQSGGAVLFLSAALNPLFAHFYYFVQCWGQYITYIFLFKRNY